MQGQNAANESALTDDNLYDGYIGQRLYDGGEDEDLERWSEEDLTESGTSDGGEEEEGGDQGSRLSGKVPWLLMTAIMTSEVVGNGVLALPRAFARLGWIPAQLTLLILFVVTTHTGVLIYRIKAAYPELRSYPHLFARVFGKAGYRYASVVVYLVLFMYTSAAVLVQAKSWEAAIPTLSLTEWVFITSAISWVVLQFRTMKNVGVLCVFGIVTIIIPVVLSTFALGNMVSSGAFPRGPHVLFGDNFGEGVVAVMDMLYAFAGHVVFFELLTQMRSQNHFSHALGISQTAVYIIYVSVGSILYGICGDAEWMVSPFTIAIVPGVTKSIVQALIIAHITINISVNGNILTRAVQNRMEPCLKSLSVPRDSNENDSPSVAPREDKSISALLWWAAWSALVLIFVSILIIIIPDFGSSMAKNRTNTTHRTQPPLGLHDTSHGSSQI